MSTNGSLRVGVTTKALAWITIVFFGFCAVAAWQAGQGEVSPLFMFFVLLGTCLLVMTGPIEMDAFTITYRTLLGRYQLRWDEVRQVEADHRRQALVFYADDKRLAILGPYYWWGQEKQRMVEFLEQEMARRQIPLRYTARALYTLSKNTRSDE